MNKYLVLVCPEAYNINVPPEAPHYLALESLTRTKWGWCNLNKLTGPCYEAHKIAHARFGNPKVCTLPWATSGNRTELLTSFGLMMKTNETPLRCEKIMYTYVRCHETEELEVSDYRLRTDKLPSEEDVRRDRIFVSTGWAMDVLESVRKGIYKYTVECAPDAAPIFCAHHTDGTTHNY